MGSNLSNWSQIDALQEIKSVLWLSQAAPREAGVGEQVKGTRERERRASVQAQGDVYCYQMV